MNTNDHFPAGAIVSRNVTDDNGEPLDRVQFGRVIRVTECDRDLGFENIVLHQWCVYEVDFAAVEDLKIPASVEEIYAPELRFEDEPTKFYWGGVPAIDLHCVCGTPHPVQIFDDAFPSRMIRQCGQCGAIADLDESSGDWIVRVTDMAATEKFECAFCAAVPHA